MNRRLFKFSLLTVIVVLSAMVVFTGCSNNSPLGPDQGNLEEQLLGKCPIMSTNSMAITVLTSVSENVQALTGGVIGINRNAYLHEFIVKEGGLDEDTEIFIESYNDKMYSKDVIVFEFGPDGLIFKKASKLNFEIAELNLNADEARLYYYDPDSRRWTLQATNSVKDGHVEFDIYHFSKYAISE